MELMYNIPGRKGVTYMYKCVYVYIYVYSHFPPLCRSDRGGRGAFPLSGVAYIQDALRLGGTSVFQG
jgi:hypothetical protein